MIKRCLFFVLIFLVYFPFLAMAQTSISLNSGDNTLLDILGYWQSIDRNNSTDNFINPNQKVYFTISKDNEKNYFLNKFQIEDYLIMEIVEKQDKEFIFLLEDTIEDGETIIDSKIYKILFTIKEKNKGIIIDYERKLFGLDQEIIEIKRLAGPNYN